MENSLEERIHSVIDSFKEPFAADGGDLRAVRITPDAIDVRIVLGQDACRECIMPPEVTQEILASAIKNQFGIDLKVNVSLTDDSEQI